jgi:uncharacterized protein YndB with AHSA1/START domain
MSAEPEKRDLVFTRVFDAPVEEVWRAWTEPEYVKQWWGPDGFTAPLAEMDVREGGTSLVCMSSADFGDHYSTWAYQELCRWKGLSIFTTWPTKRATRLTR